MSVNRLKTANVLCLSSYACTGLHQYITNRRRRDTFTCTDLTDLLNVEPTRDAFALKNLLDLSWVARTKSALYEPRATTHRQPGVAPTVADETGQRHAVLSTGGTTSQTVSLTENSIFQRYIDSIFLFCTAKIVLCIAMLSYKVIHFKYIHFNFYLKSIN